MKAQRERGRAARVLHLKHADCYARSFKPRWRSRCQFNDVDRKLALNLGGAGKMRFHQRFEPRGQPPRSRNDERAGAAAYELSVEDEARQAAEMVGMQM